MEDHPTTRPVFREPSKALLEALEAIFAIYPSNFLRVNIFRGKDMAHIRVDAPWEEEEGLKALEDHFGDPQVRERLGVRNLQITPDYLSISLNSRV